MWVEIIKNHYYILNFANKSIYKISADDPQSAPVHVLNLRQTGPRDLFNQSSRSFLRSKYSNDSLLIFGSQDEHLPPLTAREKFCFLRFNTSTLESEQVNFELKVEGTHFTSMIGFLTTPRDQELVSFSTFGVLILKVDFENLKVFPLRNFSTRRAKIIDCKLSGDGGQLICFMNKGVSSRKRVKNPHHPLKAVKFTSLCLKSDYEIKKAIIEEKKNKIMYRVCVNKDKIFGCVAVIDLRTPVEKQRLRDYIHFQKIDLNDVVEVVIRKLRPKIAVFLIFKGSTTERVIYDLSRHRLLKKEKRRPSIAILEKLWFFSEAKKVRHLGDGVEILTGGLNLLRINSNP